MATSLLISLAMLAIAAQPRSPLDSWLREGEMPLIGNASAYADAEILSVAPFADHGEARCVSNAQVTVYLHQGTRSDEGLVSILLLNEHDPACRVSAIDGLDWLATISREIAEAPPIASEIPELLNEAFSILRQIRVDRCRTSWREIPHGYTVRHRGYQACLLGDGRGMYLYLMDQSA